MASKPVPAQSHAPTDQVKIGDAAAVELDILLGLGPVFCLNAFLLGHEKPAFVVWAAAPAAGHNPPTAP